MVDYAALLRDHVTLTCRSVDRILLQAYVPRLQSAGMVGQFLRCQRGFLIPSSAAFGKIAQAYAAEVHRPVCHLRRPLADQPMHPAPSTRRCVAALAYRSDATLSAWHCALADPSVHPCGGHGWRGAAVARWGGGRGSSQCEL